MPGSMMLSGVEKSGSPISRWTMRLPSASRRRAFASTSKALSVPRRVIRSANLMVTFGMLMDPKEGSTVDADRLAADVSRLLRAKEGTRGAELRRIAEPAHRRARGHPADLLVRVGARGRRHLAGAVRADCVRGEAVYGDSVGRQLERQGFRESRNGRAQRVRQRDVG